MRSRLSNGGFSSSSRKGVYEAIYKRRDIRLFQSRPIPDSALFRILDAAHHSGSVGFMQPWNFILVQDRAVRSAIHALFQKERAAAAMAFEPARRKKYLSYKLEGILEAPVNLCVTCDPNRGGEVLGRHSIPETDLYSTCLAIQNLWLAARAEGVGVGWVSILSNDGLREALKIPKAVQPVAYLCLGYPISFPNEPFLERAGWARRLHLADLVYFDAWESSEIALSGRDAGGVLERLKDRLDQQRRKDRMKKLRKMLASVKPMDRSLRKKTQARLDRLTKPAGSLGKLEEIACRYVAITGNEKPRLQKKRIYVFAADHGVTAEGVSAYPKEVTAQMVYNFLRGGAAINVLARQAGAEIRVVDVGVDHDFGLLKDLVQKKVARGTRNMAEGPAMTEEEVAAALEVGLALAEEAAQEGVDLIAVGEMGIGNTTASSAITAVLTDAPLKIVTGRGTGLDDAGLKNKMKVIERAIKVNRPDPKNPLDVLIKVGGLEIAAIAGLIIGAAAERIPVVIDGFISTAGALIAVRMKPAVADALFASHQSVEGGHRVLLREMGLAPLVDLGLRLGEGTGSALAMNLIDASLKILTEMATFGEAGVSERGTP